MPEKNGSRQHTRAVLRLSNVPAAQLANTITALLRAEGQGAGDDSLPTVVIVPDTINNSLVVAGATEAVDVVRQLAAQLDHAAAMIRLELVMGDVPAAKVAHGADAVRNEMEVLVQTELTTLENQPAFVQVGRLEPHITAVTGTKEGRINSTTLDNVGTIVKFTPRVAPDRSVTLQLDVVDSRRGPMEEGVIIFAPTNGDPVRTPTIENSETNTTLHIADGETVVVSSDTVRAPKTDKQRVLLLTVHVSAIGGDAKGAK